MLMFAASSVATKLQQKLKALMIRAMVPCTEDDPWYTRYKIQRKAKERTSPVHHNSSTVDGCIVKGGKRVTD